VKEEQDDEGGDVLIVAKLDAERDGSEKNEDADKVNPSCDAAKRASERLFFLALCGVAFLFAPSANFTDFLKCCIKGPFEKTLDAPIDEFLELNKFFMDVPVDVLEKIRNSFDRKRGHEETEVETDTRESKLDDGDFEGFVPRRLDAPEGNDKDSKNNGTDDCADFHEVSSF